MVVHVNRWRPDTCSCYLRQSWDDAVPATSRIHRWVETLEPCPEHVGLVGQALWDAMKADNDVKNFTLEVAFSIESAIPPDATSYEWEFGPPPARVLTVSFPGITLNAARLNQIQDACDIRFGPGKVVVT